MAGKHPGFQAVQKKIEGEGYSKQAAGAILAKKTRDASPAAKKANPKLRKVKPAKNQPKSQAQGIMNKMLDKDGDGY